MKSDKINVCLWFFLGYEDTCILDQDVYYKHGLRYPNNLSPQENEDGRQQTCSESHINGIYGLIGFLGKNWVCKRFFYLIFYFTWTTKWIVIVA